MADTALERLSIREIGRRLRDRSLTAVVLVDHAIARHERYGTTLNAYKHFDAEAARRSAKAADAAFEAGADLGPLQGIPVSIKDLLGVAGMPTYGGSKHRLPARWEAEGPIVAGLRRQQAPIMGKAHTVEFAYDGLGVNQHWGAPRNPWGARDHRMPGGSSSGAGVSIHEGSSYVSIGTDSGGSVRMPASWTGTVGLKTTHGRWSLDGLVPCSPTLDSPGPLTRTVEDSAIAFAAIDPVAEGTALLKSLDQARVSDFRLGFCERHFFENCAPGVAEGVMRSIEESVAKGARRVAMDFPEARQAIDAGLSKTISSVEFYGCMQTALPEWLGRLGPILAARLDGADDPRPVSAIDYFRGLERHQELCRAAEARLAGVDVLVAPTVVSTPPREDEVATIETYLAPNRAVHQNTYLVNLLGLCAISMPVALDAAGMPVGLQLIGRANDEERVLACARAIEKVVGTAEERLGVAPLCR
ncbi:MAG: amidase [Alphaproteobacteria bacterium]